MQASTPSSVWQRRTNRLIAAAVIVIGLTMMLSNITQCIYAGMIFIIISLMSLAYMTMKERKVVAPLRPEDQPSPVLFLVTSHMLPRSDLPTIANANDKPPSYDQIVTLDGLPPEYSSVLQEKPPRYEDLSLQQEKYLAAIPSTSGITHSSRTENQTTTSCYTTENNIEQEQRKIDLSRSNSIGTNKGVSKENIDLSSSIYNRSAKNSSSLPRHAEPPQRDNRTRKRNYSSNSNTARQQAAPVHRTPVAKPPSQLLRLQVPTLSQDIADAGSVYLDGPMHRGDIHFQEASRQFSNPDNVSEHNLYNSSSVRHSSSSSEPSDTIIKITDALGASRDGQIPRVTVSEDSTTHSSAPL